MKKSSNTQKTTSLTKFANKNNIAFYLCDCKNEILVIDYDTNQELADFCIYESPSIKMSFWQKCRHILRLFMKGTPYCDQMVLTKKQLGEIKQFIEQII